MGPGAAAMPPKRRGDHGAGLAVALVATSVPGSARPDRQCGPVCRGSAAPSSGRDAVPLRLDDHTEGRHKPDFGNNHQGTVLPEPS